MKRLATYALAFAAVTSSANAADLAVPRSSYFVPASFSWTGFYAGLNAGYAFSSSNVVTTGTPGFLTLVPGGFVPATLNARPDGFLGGIQVGYNVQYQQLVIGVEGDLQFAQVGKRAAFVGPAVLGTRLQTEARSKMEAFGTLRARIGFTPVDRMMVYATAGLAMGLVSLTGTVTGLDAPALVWSAQRSQTRVGYAVGAGFEYAVTNTVSLKGEYLYYDLGRQTVLAPGNAAVRGVAALNGIDYAARTDTRGSLVRVGINYRF